jgi:hypothetical protein
MDHPLAQVARQAVEIGPPAARDCAGLLHPQDMAPIMRLVVKLLK